MGSGQNMPAIVKLRLIFNSNVTTGCCSFYSSMSQMNELDNIEVERVVFEFSRLM